MCHRKGKKTIRTIPPEPPSPLDPNGSYTVKPEEETEVPVQDADDL